MKQIIFATGNAGKMKEIREILNGTGWNVLSLKDAGIDTEIEENGTTFEENAKIKAEGIESNRKKDQEKMRRIMELVEQYRNNTD